MSSIRWGCCLPTPLTLASGGWESDLPACGPPVSLSVHLSMSAVTPAGYVHKSRSDNVVRMWVQLKRFVLCVCECYKGGIVVRFFFWFRPKCYI